MNLLQAIMEALESLRANKMRSILTILGIVIGVGAVIAMLAIGAGAQAEITGGISGIGSDLLFVFSGNQEEEVRNASPLTVSDAVALRDSFSAPSVKAVAPVILENGDVAYAGNQKKTNIYGVTPDYGPVRNYELLEGEFISDDEILGRASVVLLGPDVADQLFDRRYGLVGETVRINGQPFRVIGVLAPKGGSAFGSEDDVVLIPFSTAQSRIIRRSNDRVDLIYVQAIDSDSMEQAAEEIRQILRARHRRFLEVDDFTVFSQQDFVQIATMITGVLTAFLGGIAAISLLVGGIGIMNIMLVSVTERTKEIGLRKALGARKRDILLQFLTESALLSFLGGVIGIIFGWSLSFIVGRIASATGTQLNPVVGWNAILLATAFSTAVGLFFGIYPANRAGNLEPVDALRHD
jgi:putative ABC transport system permease protein